MGNAIHLPNVCVGPQNCQVHRQRVKQVSRSQGKGEEYGIQQGQTIHVERERALGWALAGGGYTARAMNELNVMV